MNIYDYSSKKQSTRGKIYYDSDFIIDIAYSILISISSSLAIIDLTAYIFPSALLWHLEMTPKVPSPIFYYLIS